MVASHVIKARVTADVKRQVTEAAQRELLTESLWLRRLVDRALVAPVRSEKDEGVSNSTRACAGPPLKQCQRNASARTRVQVRLRREDCLLLRERATARAMPAATYLAVLLRSHLRALAPLPREELAALKRSIAELSAIGRNLNQLVRVAHETGRASGPGRDEVVLMLKVCEAMRDHVKSLVRANVRTWESGFAETRD